MNEILDVFEEIVVVVLIVNELMFKIVMIKSWWLFFVCFLVLLVLGLYGMLFLMFWNFGLLVFGEVIGFLVFLYGDLII